MSNSSSDPFVDLSHAQRILLAEMLWDTIAASSEHLPVSDAVKAELDQRLTAEAMGQLGHEDWQKVKQRLLGK